MKSDPLDTGALDDRIEAPPRQVALPQVTALPVREYPRAGKWFYISATSADPVVVNTTTITFSAWTGTTYTADGDGIALSGTTFSLELDGTTLAKAAAGIKVADSGIGATQLATGAVTARRRPPTRPSSATGPRPRSPSPTTSATRTARSWSSAGRTTT